MTWLLVPYFAWNYVRALELLQDGIDDPWPTDIDGPHNAPFYIGIWFVGLLLLFGGVIDVLRLTVWLCDREAVQ